MKFINSKSILLTALSFGVLVSSCSSDDDNTGASTLSASDATAVIAPVTPALVFGSTINVDEADENSYTFSVTLDKIQVSDVKIAVTQTAGSAVMGDDFEVSDVVIPANSLTGTGTIKILNDDTVEVMENVTLLLGSNTANANVTTKTVSFNINNYLEDAIDLTFDFNHAVNFGLAGTSSLCAITYDMDFYVLDSALNDTGIYDAAASGCPEALTLDSTLPDGIYYIYFDIFDTGNVNGGANTAGDGLNSVYHSTFDIPVTVNFSRAGGIDPGKFVQEEAFWTTSTTAPGAAGSSDYVITIEKTGNLFSLRNSTDDVIASGKSANNLAKVKNAINTAKAKRVK